MKKLFVFTYFYFLSFFVSLAQEYPVRVFTTNEGLSQMQVNCVFKDSRGYIWAGTKYSFCKFNGEKFTRYKPIIGILGTEIYKIAEDNNGLLYIASNEGVCRFDGNRFERIKGIDGIVSDICIDDNNQLFALHDEIIYKTTILDTLQRAKAISLKKHKYVNILFDKFHQTFIAYERGIGIVSFNNTSKHILFALPNKGGNIATQLGKNGEIIFHYNYQNEHEYYMLNKNGKIEPFLVINDTHIQVKKTINFSLPFSVNGTNYLLEANSFSYKYLQNIASQITSSQPCYTENGIWVGTEQGLIFIAINGFEYFRKQDAPYCWGVVEDKYQRHWQFNWMKPIRVWDDKKIDSTKKYYQAMNKKIHLNKANRVDDNNKNSWYFGPIKDKWGNLWIPNGYGLLRYDYQQYQLLTPTQKDIDAISLSVLEDPERNLIISGGHLSLNIFENKYPFKCTTLTDKDGMNVRNNILGMALEKPGVYWLGGGNMLVRYDSDHKTWKEFSIKNKRTQATGFKDMCFDNRHTLWVTSFLNGLHYYDAKLDSLVQIPSEELNKPASSVLQISPNQLLIGSLRQLYILDLQAWYKNKKVVLKTFNNRNGYQGIEPGQKGLYKDSQGYVWVTSGSELSRFKLDKLVLKNDTLKTFITQFNGKSIPFNGILKDNTSTTGNVRIEFESVGENKSLDSEYSYFIEGITPTWTNWQEEPVVTLAKLASGNYSLLVKSRTGNGDDRYSKIASFDFTVKVFFWQSPYFPLYAFLILLAIIALGYFIYWKIQQKEMAIKQALIQKEQEAQQELINKEITLKKQTTQIKSLQVQTAQAQMNPHFTFNVLGTLQALIYKQDTKSANENLLKLSKLMRSYLDASISSEIDPQSQESGMITLEEEIELLQMYIDFEQLTYQDRFEAFINISPDIGTDFYKIPPLLIQPFVENAIKHGVLPNRKVFGNVGIDFTLDEQENLVCVVSDNGIGREASQLLQQTSVKTYKSLGTALVKKRVNILGELGFKIDFNYQDNPTGGTTVTIKFIYS